MTPERDSTLESAAASQVLAGLPFGGPASLQFHPFEPNRAPCLPAGAFSFAAGVASRFRSAVPYPTRGPAIEDGPFIPL